MNWKCLFGEYRLYNKLTEEQRLPVSDLIVAVGGEPIGT